MPIVCAKLFNFKLTVCVGLVIRYHVYQWYHVYQMTDDGRIETFFAVGQGTGSFILPITAITFIFTFDYLRGWHGETAAGKLRS